MRMRLRRLSASIIAAASLVLNFSPGPIDAEAVPSESVLSDQFLAIQERLHKILTGTRENAKLALVTRRLTDVGRVLYGRNYEFYLVTEPGPNAAASFGSRIYVNRDLVDFVANREELASVLCHEMSHVLHDDTYRDYAVVADRYDRTTAAAVARLEAMTSGHFSGTFESGAGEVERLFYYRYTRAEETAADLKGSEICSLAGFNPYGMLWIFRTMSADYGSGGPSWFSDHPSFPSRARSLRQHFKNNSALYARWADDEADATKI